MEIVDGAAILPTRAGLGSALDYEALKAYRIDAMKMLT